MTEKERKELKRIRKERGRAEQEQATRPAPTYKDAKTQKRYAFRLFGRHIEIKVSNTNK